MIRLRNRKPVQEEPAEMPVAGAKTSGKRRPSADAPIHVSVVIPAYNEAGAIGAVIAGMRAALDTASHAHEIIVVDDGSTDETARAAAEAGATVVSRAYNTGNGAAVKTGIRNARGNTILFMDGDGQHTPEDAMRVLDALVEGRLDMVVGSRNSGSQAGHHRALANTLYNTLASYVVGRAIPDLTSGMRAVRREVAAEFVPLLPNTFSYPTTLTLALFRSGYGVGYVPITARTRTGKSKIKLLRDGTRFLLIILKVCTLVSPMKVFLPVSAIPAAVGIANFVYTYATLGRFTNMSLMMFMFAFQLFMLGLIAEQITQLYYSRSGK